MNNRRGKMDNLTTLTVVPSKFFLHLRSLGWEQPLWPSSEPLTAGAVVGCVTGGSCVGVTLEPDLTVTCGTAGKLTVGFEGVTEGGAAARSNNMSGEAEEGLTASGGATVERSLRR